MSSLTLSLSHILFCLMVFAFYLLIVTSCLMNFPFCLSCITSYLMIKSVIPLIMLSLFGSMRGSMMACYWRFLKRGLTDVTHVQGEGVPCARFMTRKRKAALESRRGALSMWAMYP